jgi:hypothetical protein
MDKRREGKPGGARAEEARALEARADEGRASVKRSAVDTRLVINDRIVSAFRPMPRLHDFPVFKFILRITDYFSLLESVVRVHGHSNAGYRTMK